MVITDFQVENKVNRPKSFQKTFLVAGIEFEIILEISFLKISNIDILFSKKTFIKKSYTTNKAFFITKQV